MLHYSNHPYYLSRNRGSAGFWRRLSYREGNLRLSLTHYTANASPREIVKQLRTIIFNRKTHALPISVNCIEDLFFITKSTDKTRSATIAKVTLCTITQNEAISSFVYTVHTRKKNISILYTYKLSNTESTFKFFIFVECYAIMLSMFKNVLSVTYLCFRITYLYRSKNCKLCKCLWNHFKFHTFFNVLIFRIYRKITMENIASQSSERTCLSVVSLRLSGFCRAIIKHKPCNFRFFSLSYGAFKPGEWMLVHSPLY